MDKSQLRRLARDYSLGKVERGEYVRRRRNLLDGIVDGDIEIEHETPLEDTIIDMVRAPQADAEEEVPARATSLIYAGVGVVVLILVGGLAWLLFQPTEEPVAPAPLVEAIPSEVLAPGASARTLVESFVAVRDWSAASVGDFKGEWASLTEEQRLIGREAPWFRRLTKAIRDELKTQKALVEFDKTGKARETGIRIISLSEFLGTGDSLPSFPTQAPAPTETQPATDAAQVTVQTTNAISTPAAVDTATVVVTAKLPGPKWLSSLAPEQITLQLFAVNHLHKVAALKAQYSALDLHILDFPDSSPRYRVLHGSYGSEAQAKAAHSELPRSLLKEQPKPYLKTAAELQALSPNELEDLKLTSTQAGNAAEAEQPPFTLQVFASSNKENVDKLVARHPVLQLRVQETSSTSAKYRVLFGTFESEQQARVAAGKLPTSILSATGQPIIKSLAGLAAISP